MRTPATSLQAIRSGPAAREILVRFLRRERGAILDSWSRALGLGGGGLSQAASPPPHHPSALAKFLSLFERHLGDPFFRGNFYYLRRLILRGSPAEFPLAEVVRGQILLKRTLIERLVQRYRSTPFLLREMCNIVEEAVDEQRTRLAQELLEAHQRAIQTQREGRSRLLAILSHDLVAPLTSIVGYAEALLDGEGERSAGSWREDLEKILHNARSMKSLLTDLSDLSRLEVRALPLLVETFPLGPCLEEALLAVEPGMRSKGLRLERHLEKGLPPLRADRTKTRQILVNLLCNAIRFTPPGGRLTVAARAVADGRIQGSGGGWRIHVSVIDTGIGIPRDRLGHLFGDPTPLRRWPLPAAAEGMGLGLAIVRHLVELHGGRIWTRSTVNTGSRFTFTLPAACPPP